ncbi:MAG: hypothetical protein H5T97_09665, partial [Firmicutes bacterium]|nr:hypothetical protein [Bacillota bacterium]
ADADNYPTRAIINGLWPKLIPDDSWARMAFAVTVDRVKEDPGTEIVLMDFEAARKRLFGTQKMEKQENQNPTEEPQKNP